MTEFKTLKTIIAGIVITAGFVSGASSASAKKDFIDIPKSGSYSKELKALNNLNAFDYKVGKKLNPSEVLTRGESAKILYTLKHTNMKKVRTYKANYTDINKSKFKKEIKWAYEVGIYDANSAKEFRPNSKLSKAQATKVLVRTYKPKAGKDKVPATMFKSANYSNTYAKRLATNGIYLNNSKGVYDATAPITTEVFAKAVYKTKAMHSQTAVVKQAKKPVVKKPIVNKKKYYTLAETKKMGAKLYKETEWESEEVYFYTKSDFTEAYTDYFVNNDVVKDIPGYGYYGKGIILQVVSVYNGIHKMELQVINQRTKAQNTIWLAKMDKAEKNIRAKYPLKTEYDVVYAINDYVIKNLEYGVASKRTSVFAYSWEGNSGCTAYASIVAELHKRFGLESTIQGGSAHAWNMVKLGGKWYATDSTFNDVPGAETKYLVMTQKERDVHISWFDSKLRATNVPFDISKSVAYKAK